MDNTHMQRPNPRNLNRSNSSSTNQRSSNATSNNSVAINNNSNNSSADNRNDQQQHQQQHQQQQHTLQQQRGLDWVLGLPIRVKTITDEEHEGQIYAYDSKTSCVVLHILYYAVIAFPFITFKTSMARECLFH